MEFTRNLKKGTSGEDVLFCKQKLLELGFYGDHITTVTKKTFGADTLEAVKRFQTQAGLTVDGVIGKETWAALFGDTATGADPITKGTVSAKAKAICALALTRIGDLYVWGASGMTDLSNSKIQAMDEEFARAIKFRDSQYKAGFAELMAHDCSGFISWLMRETACSRVAPYLRLSKTSASLFPVKLFSPTLGFALIVIYRPNLLPEQLLPMTEPKPFRK